MIRKFNSIAATLFLLVFLLPTIVKLEHHHEHLVSVTINDRQNQVFHGKCAICDFEFSVFLTLGENIDLQKENPLDSYCNNYNSRYNSSLFLFSFLLRAPPDKQI
jgi:hypothetical protein